MDEETLDELRWKMKLHKKFLATSSKQIRDLKDSLKETCTHPLDFVIEIEWEHDNGYGTQTKHKAMRCTICNKDNRWGHWSQYG